MKGFAAAQQQTEKPAVSQNSTNPVYLVYNNSMCEHEICGGVLMKYKGSSTEVTVPETVCRIADGCFSQLMITAISIPDSVTEIGAHAFDGCTKLESVKLPSNLETIGDYAFRGCRSLKEMQIPASVTSLGACAFAECTSIEALQILGDTEPEYLYDEYRHYGYSAFLKETKHQHGFACFYLHAIEFPESENIRNVFEWKLRGHCQYCGGEFNFRNKCKCCGKFKDYDRVGF